MSKFKQFWFNNIHYPIIVNNFKDWPKERPEKRKDLIHVIEYRAYKAAQKEIKRLKDVVASFNASPKTISSDIQKAFNREHSMAVKLQLENKVLKEKLKLAESQIDDLKQQMDKLYKAVYQKNRED